MVLPNAWRISCWSLAKDFPRRYGGKAGYACPLTQYHLADALGLSAVHVNRVLRQLREIRMVTFRDGFDTFDDYDRLTKFAEFELTYLDQVGPLVN